MKMDLNFLKKNGFKKDESFEKIHTLVNEINKDQFGIFCISSTKTLDQTASDLDESLFPINTPKISYSEAKNKILLGSEILLIGIPHFLYNSKYTLINEIINLYDIGSRNPNRNYFGKLLFCLKNFNSLSVTWKFCDYHSGVDTYLDYLKIYKENFGTLPFANFSEQRPKRPFQF